MKPLSPLGLLLGALALGACDASRERPTGLGTPLPATTVVVLAPRAETSVAADSTETVVVEATGLITAVEFFLTGASFPDTLALDRSEFGEPREVVQVDFEVTIPRYETGTHLVIRGVAEDLIGQRHVSQPVVVMVIECDVFPLACGGF